MVNFVWHTGRNYEPTDKICYYWQDPFFLMQNGLYFRLGYAIKID